MRGPLRTRGGWARFREHFARAKCPEKASTTREIPATPLEIAPLEAGIPRESCDARTEEAGSRSGGTRLNSFLWKEADERNGVPGQKCFRPIPARKTGSSSTRLEGREVNRRGEIEIDKSAQESYREMKVLGRETTNSVSSERRSRNEGCRRRALAGRRVGFVMRRFIEWLLELCLVLEDNDRARICKNGSNNLFI